MELWDTHCHLDQSPICERLDEVLCRARGAGVTHIIAPSYNRASWLVVADLGGRAGVGLAFGLHPQAASEPLARQVLREQLRTHGAVAVGEIGLDAKVGLPDRATQMAALELQLDVAEELDLPVLLHCRGWFDDLLKVLRSRVPVRGVLHAFSRGAELARRFVDTGLHIGLGGAVTRHNANRVLDAARQLPLERIVLETDAPSIPVEGLLAGEVEPCHVLDIARAIADVRGLTLPRVAKVTSDNARALFRIA